MRRSGCSCGTLPGNNAIDLWFLPISRIRMHASSSMTSQPSTLYILFRSSYENLPKWIDFVKETRGDEAVVFMVGNKSDCPSREVEVGQGESFAKSNDVFFYEVSAKTGQNIQTLFRNISMKLQQKYNAQEEEAPAQLKQSKTTKLNVNNATEPPNPQSGCRCWLWTAHFRILGNAYCKVLARTPEFYFLLSWMPPGSTVPAFHQKNTLWMISSAWCRWWIRW